MPSQLILRNGVYYVRMMVKGRRVKVVGVGNKLFAFLPRLAPRRMVAFMAGIFLKKRW